MLINDLSQLRACLVEARNRQGVTVRQLAKLTGKSATQICNIEQGHSVPTVETVLKICSALKISVLFNE